MLQVDKISHINNRYGLKFTIYLLITHEPSSCPGTHISNCIYHNLKFVYVYPHRITQLCASSGLQTFQIFSQSESI